MVLHYAVLVDNQHLNGVVRAPLGAGLAAPLVGVGEALARYSEDRGLVAIRHHHDHVVSLSCLHHPVCSVRLGRRLAFAGDRRRPGPELKEVQLVCGVGFRLAYVESLAAAGASVVVAHPNMLDLAARVHVPPAAVPFVVEQPHTARVDDWLFPAHLSPPLE